MSVVDIHPEDLLDRAHNGGLTSVETERLERHLAQCVACRLEHRSRTDFEGFEKEEGLDAADFDVQRLLSEVLAPGTDRELLRSPPMRRPVPGRRWQSVLLIAATLLVAGAATAAGWTGARALRAPMATAPPLVAVALVASSSVPHATPSFSARPPVTDDTPLPPSPPVVTAPPSASASPVGPALPVARAKTGDVRMAHEPPVVAAPPLPDAPWLFDRANRARRSGDHARASELYLELIDRFPESPEGHESEAVLGHLLLHDGDARAALGHLDAYLGAGGPLTEDVTLDRALALGRLGRASDESDAWRRLLHDYPSSVHRERARSRLQELGSP
jgi:hypothetical protein